MLILYVNEGGAIMKKFILISMLVLSAGYALAQEITDANIEHSPEYYRQQIIVVQNYSNTNFMKAVYEGDTKIVEAYVKSGMSPDSEMMGLPAVMYAIGANRPESLETLIKNGANTEITTMGLTPLLFAVNKKSPECAEVLVRNNANINAQYKGVSALNAAITRKQYDTAELLLKAGAKVDDDVLIKAIKSNNEDIKNLTLKTAVSQIGK